jgi:hypothetical protein
MMVPRAEPDLIYVAGEEIPLDLGCGIYAQCVNCGLVECKDDTKRIGTMSQLGSAIVLSWRAGRRGENWLHYYQGPWKFVPDDVIEAAGIKRPPGKKSVAPQMIVTMSMLGLPVEQVVRRLGIIPSEYPRQLHRAKQIVKERNPTNDS